MNPVITQEQARQVTGGREPFGITEYEKAVALLRECLHIDDARRFATFADAKAAWARIVHDQTVLRLSRALKLHAARKMAEIAARERPSGRNHVDGKAGFRPGARSLLMEHGMTQGEADAAGLLARLPQGKFDELIQRPRPPSLNKDLFSKPQTWGHFHAKLKHTAGLLRETRPADAVRFLLNSPRADVERAKTMAQDITDWLDEFLQRLPK